MNRILRLGPAGLLFACIVVLCIAGALAAPGGSAGGGAGDTGSGEAEAPDPVALLADLSGANGLAAELSSACDVLSSPEGYGPSIHLRALDAALGLLTPEAITELSPADRLRLRARLRAALVKLVRKRPFAPAPEVLGRAARVMVELARPRITADLPYRKGHRFDSLFSSLTGAARAALRGCLRNQDGRYMPDERVDCARAARLAADGALLDALADVAGADTERPLLRFEARRALSRILQQALTADDLALGAAVLGASDAAFFGLVDELSIMPEGALVLPAEGVGSVEVSFLLPVLASSITPALFTTTPSVPFTLEVCASDPDPDFPGEATAVKVVFAGVAPETLFSLHIDPSTLTLANGESNLSGPLTLPLLVASGPSDGELPSVFQLSPPFPPDPFHPGWNAPLTEADLLDLFTASAAPDPPVVGPVPPHAAFTMVFSEPLGATALFTMPEIPGDFVFETLGADGATTGNLGPLEKGGVGIEGLRSLSPKGLAIDREYVVWVPSAHLSVGTDLAFGSKDLTGEVLGFALDDSAKDLAEALTGVRGFPGDFVARYRTGPLRIEGPGPLDVLNLADLDLAGAPSRPPTDGPPGSAEVRLVVAERSTPDAVRLSLLDLEGVPVPDSAVACPLSTPPDPACGAGARIAFARTLDEADGVSLSVIDVTLFPVVPPLPAPVSLQLLVEAMLLDEVIGFDFIPIGFDTTVPSIPGGAPPEVTDGDLGDDVVDRVCVTVNDSDDVDAVSLAFDGAASPVVLSLSSADTSTPLGGSMTRYCWVDVPIPAGTTRTATGGYTVRVSLVDAAGNESDSVAVVVACRVPPRKRVALGAGHRSALDVDSSARPYAVTTSTDGSELIGAEPLAGGDGTWTLLQLDELEPELTFGVALDVAVNDDLDAPMAYVCYTVGPFPEPNANAPDFTAPAPGGSDPERRVVGA